MLYNKKGEWCAMDDQNKKLDGCENAKQVASIYGYHIVCDDDEVIIGQKSDDTVTNDEGCENAKSVASKYGYQMVCEDEE